MKIVSSLVDRTPFASGGQRFYRDSELAGFGLRVGIRTKTYYAESKVGGRTVRLSIGKHGLITAEEARGQAQRLLRLMAEGRHPGQAGGAYGEGSEAPSPGSDGEITFEQTARLRLREIASESELKVMGLVMNLTRVASRLIRDLDSVVHRPLGWTWPGFRIMFAVTIKGPQEQSEIARLTGFTRAAVSAAVSTLERDGLVRRAPSSTDARAVMVSMTRRGERAVMRGFHEQSRRVGRWADCLTGAEQHELVRLLRILLRRRLRALSADGATRART